MASAKKKIFNFSLLRRVFAYTAPYRGRLYLSMIMSVVLAVVSPVRPYLIQVTVNKYIKGGEAAAPGQQSPFLEMIIAISIWQVVPIYATIFIAAIGISLVRPGPHLPA